MTVGLPGVGLGGIFYLVSAAFMPVRELLRAVRGESPARWRLVRKQTAMAAAILGALWLTGWMLGVLIASAPAAIAGEGRAVPIPQGAQNALRAGALAISLGTLLVVLASVQVARLLVTRKKTSSVPDIHSIESARKAAARMGSAPPPAPRTGRVDSGTFGRVR